MNNIGTKIRGKRKKLGLSQEQLCGELLNRTTLSQIENNKMLPSISQLEHISLKLNVHISFFFQEENQTENVNFVEGNKLEYMHNLYKNNEYIEIVKYYDCNYAKFRKIRDISKNFYLGMAYFRLNNDESAETTLKKFTRDFNKASTDVQQKKLEEFGYAVYYIYVLTARRFCYDEKGYGLLKAKKLLEENNKTNAEVYFWVCGILAHIYVSSNKNHKCIQIIEEFFRVQKNLRYYDISYKIHSSACRAYCNIGDYDNAIKHIKKSIYLRLYDEQDIMAAQLYISYLNALRYGKYFEEACNLVQDCIMKYKEYEEYYYPLLLQEAVIFFNISSYEKALAILQQVKLRKLDIIYKYDCYFMLGHIYFVQNKYEEAKKMLLKSIGHYEKEKYYRDLEVLYNDLYKITNDITFKEKHDACKSKKYGKNIIV